MKRIGAPVSLLWQFGSDWRMLRMLWERRGIASTVDIWRAWVVMLWFSGHGYACALSADDWCWSGWCGA